MYLTITFMPTGNFDSQRMISTVLEAETAQIASQILMI